MEHLNVVTKAGTLLLQKRITPECFVSLLVCLESIKTCDRARPLLGIKAISDSIFVFAVRHWLCFSVFTIEKLIHLKM